MLQFFIMENAKTTTTTTTTTIIIITTTTTITAQAVFAPRNTILTVEGMEKLMAIVVKLTVSMQRSFMLENAKTTTTITDPVFAH